MGNFAENLNLGNRFRPPPPVAIDYFHCALFFALLEMRCSPFPVVRHSPTFPYLAERGCAALMGSFFTKNP